MIRLRNNPHKEGRRSRFFGSHTRAAWVVLGMIFLVLATLLLYRGVQINTDVFPYAHGAFASQIVGHWLAPLGYGVNSVLDVVPLPDLEHHLHRAFSSSSGYFRCAP